MTVASVANTPPARGRLLFDQTFLKQLERLRLAGQRAASAPTRGMQMHSRAGRSLEIMDYRNYRPGDDLRYLDWNAYSRLQQLVIKVFAAERNRDLHLVLDHSASMALGTPTKFDLARQITAASAYVALGHLESVWVHTFGASTGPRFGPQRRRNGFMTLLDFVETLTLEGAGLGTTNAGAALGRLAHELRRPALVMIVSDLLSVSGLAPALKSLSARGHELMVVQVLSQRDVVPDVNGYLRLHDHEPDAHVDALVDADVRRTYQGVVQDFITARARECAMARAAHLTTTTAVPFTDVVLKLMRSRGFLQ